MINEEGEESNKSKYKIEYLGEKISKDFLSYKVIFLANHGVGKSGIINKLMQKDVGEDYSPTISTDIKNFQAKVNDKIIQIQIWDCCGNDEFALSTPNLFRNASISILVYSINDINSFKNLEQWHNILQKYSYDNIIFLIGNKNNLEEERKVTLEDAEAFKNSYDDIN